MTQCVAPASNNNDDSKEEPKAAAVMTVEKGTEETADNITETAPVNMEEQPKANSKVWIWAIIIFAVIAGCATVFMVLRKKDE